MPNTITARLGLPVSSRAAATLVGLLLPIASARPQRAHMSPTISAGSEFERYARILELTGGLLPGQWTVRPFGPRELAEKRLPAQHPWAARMVEQTLADSSSLSVAAPSATLMVHSNSPQGFNDGPVWSGRGLTVSGSGGGRIRVRWLSVALEPVAFLAQNAPFTLQPNGRTGAEAYNDWVSPGQIDMPQRFGAKPYGRIDAGESHLRADLFGLTAGIATESQMWGPAVEYPLILGTNAGGIPRLFAGTSAPVDLRIARGHVLILWGRTDETEYGPSDVRRHLATAAVGSLSINGTGLELGATRFIHGLWPSNGFRGMPWLRVFQGILAANISGLDRNPTQADNQIASAFFRWAPPAAGFEIYGEFGREDRSYNLRDLIQEPDHAAAYTVGFQRAWKLANQDRLTVIRGEILNSRVSHLQQAASQYSWYSHGTAVQGHTQHGQVLGSVGAHGGGAATLAVDWYTPKGRLTARWDRIMVAENRSSTGLPQSGRADVIHSWGLERGQWWAGHESTTGLSLAREFNRHFGADAWNVSTFLSYRVRR